MKKTLIIAYEYPPQVGGIASYIAAYAAVCDPSRIVVLAPPHPDADAWDSAQPYTVIRAPFLFRGPVWPKWVRLAFTVRRIVRSHQIEQLHVHHILPVGYLAYLLKKRCSYVVFFHGTDFVRIEGRPWKRWWTNRVLGHATRIIANSTSLKERLARVFPKQADNISLVYPCPSDTLHTPPSQDTLDQLRAQLGLEHRRVILTVSRFDDGKGIPQLVRAVSLLVPQHPDLVWVLIGDGKKKHEVLDLIQTYRLQNTVRYLGALPHAEIKPYYYLADLFALLTHPDSSRKDEGFGIVFLEAAAAGLPAVAGNSGGTKEAVVHMQTGIVVHPYNELEITGAISRLLRDDALRRALGTAAKDRVLQEFTWHTQLSRIAEWL